MGLFGLALVGFWIANQLDTIAGAWGLILSASAGLGLVSLKDGNYVGALSTYVETPARDGLIAVAAAMAGLYNRGLTHQGVRRGLPWPDGDTLE